jgi:putative heme iron utilization protein
MVMNWPLYQRVALNRDLPEHGLKRGDVATLVDYVSHPEAGEQSCVLEVFNALGESVAVVVVRESEIEDLHAGEVLTVRPLAKAG